MSRRLPTTLTTAEIDALLGAARDAVNSDLTPTKQLGFWRDFVMVQTGLKAGPRVAELCSLKVPDVDLLNAFIAIKRGKGDKDRTVPIAAKLLPALKEWIGDRTEGYLFPGPNGKKMCTRTFQLRLETLAKKAGILKSVKSVHPHLMRHAFACELLRNGADIKEVQELLGHANLATTTVYLHTIPERLRAAVDRL